MRILRILPGRGFRMKMMNGTLDPAIGVSAPSKTGNAAAAIVCGGMAVGVLDTFLAMSLWRIGPVIVYQSVASGLLGRESFRGGLATAALGMFLHFFIATTAATVYWVASHNLPVMRKYMTAHWFPLGLSYGIAVYYFMQRVVLPLSNVTHGIQQPLWRVVSHLVGHAFLVGLPIAWFAQHYSEGDQG